MNAFLSHNLVSELLFSSKQDVAVTSVDFKDSENVCGFIFQKAVLLVVFPTIESFLNFSEEHCHLVETLVFFRTCVTVDVSAKGKKPPKLLPDKVAVVGEE